MNNDIIVLLKEKLSSLVPFVSWVKTALSEIQELDHVLTEIGRTSAMSRQQLKRLGMDAYDSAGKYGKAAGDYLSSVRNMNRSGFYGEKGTGMAEQSLLAQSAGDLDAGLADQYILAINAAYRLNGESEKINAVLDGQNSITSRNSVSMADMATAMTKAGTAAAGYKVKIEDLSAMIGTMEAVTGLGGDEIGDASEGILTNLQNTASSEITDTLDRAHASMTELVNGTERLRDPISILRDLAKTFNQLDGNDPLRGEILTNIGQPYHADELNALLQNMDLFDGMLSDYAAGEGSALAETEISANSLTGQLNNLSNSWSEFVNTVVDSDGLKSGVTLLNGLVEGLTGIASALTPSGSIGAAAGLFAGLKNVGRDKMYSLMF